MTSDLVRPESTYDFVVEEKDFNPDDPHEQLGNSYVITSDGVNYSEDDYEDYGAQYDAELDYCIKNIRNPFNKLAFISCYFFGVEQKHIAEVAGMTPYALGMRMTRLKQKMKREVANVNHKNDKP